MNNIKISEKEIIDELYDREGRTIVTEPEVKKPPITSYPDAKKHQIVSFIKSGIRILGYILIPFDITWAVSALVVSEIIGIIEELV